MQRSKHPAGGDSRRTGCTACEWTSSARPATTSDQRLDQPTPERQQGHCCRRCWSAAPALCKTEKPAQAMYNYFAFCFKKSLNMFIVFLNLFKNTKNLLQCHVGAPRESCLWKHGAADAARTDRVVLFNIELAGKNKQFINRISFLNKFI